VEPRLNVYSSGVNYERVKFAEQVNGEIRRQAGLYTREEVGSRTMVLLHRKPEGRGLHDSESKGDTLDRRY